MPTYVVTATVSGRSLPRAGLHRIVGDVCQRQPQPDLEQMDKVESRHLNRYSFIGLSTKSSSAAPGPARIFGTGGDDAVSRFLRMLGCGQSVAPDHAVWKALHDARANGTTVRGAPRRDRSGQVTW